MGIAADQNFCITWPFGVLKTLHVLAPLAALITIYVSPYQYTSVGFVLFTSWAFFFVSLVYLLLYVFGVQHKMWGIGQTGFAYMPLALTDFILSCLAAVLFGASTLICAISTISSLNHRASLVFTYVFATIFTAISTISFAYYAILIYRGMPNGRWRNLQFLIINGNAVTIHPASGLPSAQTTSSTSAPTGGNPPRTYVV